MDFLFVLTELFSLGVTATSEKRLKIGVLQGVGELRPNFRVQKDVHNQSFLHG